MTEKSFLDAIPVYDDIKSLNRTITQIDDLKAIIENGGTPIVKIIVTHPGTVVELTNFDHDYSISLLSSFMAFKIDQLTRLNEKFAAIQ